MDRYIYKGPMDPSDVFISTDPWMVDFYGKFVAYMDPLGNAFFERNAVKRNDDEFWLTVVVVRSL